ncbi:M15 family metallopeptidase [Psychromonas sp.]|uniref:M15 family metallopeptidase n=1 Tax=Psychromonas sp. TaxID=1884585 RepID=UPI0035617E9E
MLAEQLTGQVLSHLDRLTENIYLHKQAIPAFEGLQSAAKDAGFNLQIASGFRSFERQRLIWNNKFSGKTRILDKNEQPLITEQLSDSEKLFAILHWSALPGASRHHWGTDFDIYDPNLLPKDKSLQLTVSEYTYKGYFFELNQWLSDNMKRFDFYRPYQQYNGGVAIEPWHLSYLPVAENAMEQLTQPLIKQTILENNVLGKSLICEQLPIIYKQFICNVQRS